MRMHIAVDVLAIAQRQQRTIHEAQLIGFGQLPDAVMQGGVDDAPGKTRRTPATSAARGKARRSG